MGLRNIIGQWGQVENEELTSNETKFYFPIEATTWRRFAVTYTSACTLTNVPPIGFRNPASTSYGYFEVDISKIRDTNINIQWHMINA